MSVHTHILRHSDKTVYGTTWQYLAGTVSCGNNRIAKHTTLNAYGLLQAKIPRHQELKTGVQQRNTDIIGRYEQSCAKSSFFAFSSGEINWERKQKGKKEDINQQLLQSYCCALSHRSVCCHRTANTFTTSLLKDHDMSRTPYAFLAEMGMLLLSQKQFRGGTEVESRGNYSLKDRKGKV